MNYSPVIEFSIFAKTQNIAKNGDTLTISSRLGEGTKFCVTLPKAD